MSLNDEIVWHIQSGIVNIFSAEYRRKMTEGKRGAQRGTCRAQARYVSSLCGQPDRRHRSSNTGSA